MNFFSKLKRRSILDGVSMVMKPPPTPDRCEGRLFPPKQSDAMSNTDASQFCLRKPSVCRLGCVEFIYTSVSGADTLSFVTTAHRTAAHRKLDQRRDDLPGPDFVNMHGMVQELASDISNRKGSTHVSDSV